MSDFTAVYLPSLPEGKENPTKDGFATEAEAEEYVFSQMCSACQEERRIALSGEKDEDGDSPDEYPGCFFEWLIVPTKEDGYGSFEELMKAGGWETIYQALPDID